MEKYMKERPKKIIFSKNEQKKIFRKMKSFVLKDLLPNPKINKIIIFGSMAKGALGKYETSHKSRKVSRFYSDIDILLMVEDNFEIHKKWKPHFSCQSYDVFNIIKLDKKIPIQYMVCRKSKYGKKKHQKSAEIWGVPLLLNKSKHKYIILYEKPQLGTFLQYQSPSHKY